ncbi:MAG: type VI secretion system contractile sheath domain-containing protein [Phycisphaerae bacterium]
MTSDDVNVEVSPGTDTPEVPGRRPYAMVLISDLGAGQQLDRLTAANKDEFAGLLSRAKPKLALALKDPFRAGPGWEFQLTFDSLKAFEPAGILAQVPGAGWRLGVREKIVARRQAKIGSADLDNAINAAAGADASLAWLTQPDAAAAPGAGAAQAAPPEPAGPSILDLVEEPDESARVSAEVERLAKAAGDADARISGAEGARLNDMLARLDHELGRIAEALLKHRDVRRLETAWRCLKFMIDRIEFRDTGVRLSVLHAPRDKAVSRFVERVVNPAFDGEIPTPGLVIFDYVFANTPADMELLDELAQHAAGLPVPVVFPFDPGFFNIKGWRLLKNLPHLSGLIDGWQFAKWRSLRDQPYAKSLVPVVGRFILRAPYTTRPAAPEYGHNESIAKISDLTWTHGHLAMGICAARAYARHGWPTRMFGAEAGKLEDLPVVDNPNDPQNPWGPGDLFLPDRRIDELPEIGMNFLQAVKNNDYCILLGGVSAARPKQTAETSKHQATLEISLPYQQFANITSAYLSEQLPTLRGLQRQTVQERLLFGLANLIGIKEESEMEAVQVGVGASPEDPSKTVVQIRLTPPGRIVPGGLHIEFGFGL